MYKKGRNGEIISDKDIAIQRRNLKAQSVALKLHDGNERYVEVQIGMGPNWVTRWDIQTLRKQFSSLNLNQ